MGVRRVKKGHIHATWGPWKGHFHTLSSQSIETLENDANLSSPPIMRREHLTLLEVNQA